jgi:hypothetical protein
MGLIATVFRNADTNWPDCTNGGWSSKFHKVCVVNAEGPFEPSEDCPAVVIQRHRIMKSLHVCSEDHVLDGKITMFGGNFLYCSDSRFGALCRRLLQDSKMYGVAVSIHDRVE